MAMAVDYPEGPCSPASYIIHAMWINHNAAEVLNELLTIGRPVSFLGRLTGVFILAIGSMQPIFRRLMILRPQSDTSVQESIASTSGA
jgi:hypothetical protein